MEHMGIPEAARRLGISRQAVHSAIKRGIIRAERDGYYWHITNSELDRLTQPDEIARRAKFAPRKEANDTDNSPCDSVGIGDSGCRSDDLATVEPNQ